MSIYNFLDLSLYRTTQDGSISTSQVDPSLVSITQNGSSIGATYPDEILSGEIDGTLSFTGGFIQSKNFVTNSTGWRISADGRATQRRCSRAIPSRPC